MSTGLSTLDPCVHCGFCLQACPTFVETGDEADSPRGRIVLMQGLARGELSVEAPEIHYHLDRCLGCRACETACPSGVQYGRALEDTRARMLDSYPTPPQSRLVLAVMAEGYLRGFLLTLARWVRPLARIFSGRSRLGFGMGSLAATKQKINAPELPADDNVKAEVAGSAGPATVFRGCIMDGLFRHVNDATSRTLEVNGFTLAPAQNQGCCGALHAHAGERERARELARQNVIAFRGTGPARIVINSAGCGAMLKDYGHLLEDDPELAEEAAEFSARVVDISEILDEAGPAVGAPLNMKVAYDAPCHLHHGQRITDSPLRVLESIPGLELVHHLEREACCGSAGLYSLGQRELSLAVLDRKLECLKDAGPEVVVTGNPGCTMHIGAGLMADGVDIPVAHPVELLDLSYRRAGLGRPG